MKEYKMCDNIYVCEMVESGLKNTIYEDDIDTIDEIVNNVFNEYLELMINNIRTSYDELIKQEFLKLEIA